MNIKYTTGISKFYLLIRKTFPQAKSDQDVANSVGLSRNAIKELKTKKPTKKVFNIIIKKLNLNAEKMAFLIEHDSFYEEVTKGYKIDNEKIILEFLKNNDLNNRLSKEVYNEFLDFCIRNEYYLVNMVTFNEIVSLYTGLLSVMQKNQENKTVLRFVNADYIEEQFDMIYKDSDIKIYAKLNIGLNSENEILVGGFKSKDIKLISLALNKFAKLILKKSYKSDTKKLIDSKIKSLLEEKNFTLSNKVSKIEFFCKKV